MTAAYGGSLGEVRTREDGAVCPVAFDETMPDAPQDQWLKVHATLNELPNTVDCARLADLIAGRDDDARTQAIEAEAIAFEAQAMTRLAST